LTRAPLARALVLPLSVAGCASIIGADFDELTPARPCASCKAGAGPTGGGTGGKAGQGGSTNASGTAGFGGKPSPTGGSANVGGKGNVEPPDDGGAAGWAGEAGAPSNRCSSHAECIDRHDGKPFICRKDACVQVTTDECPVLLPRVGALDYLRRESPMLLGGFANVEAPFFEDTATVNWDLAFSEFHGATSEGRAFGERPVVAVVCNSSDEAFMPALRHLTLELGVPGVLSTLPPEKLLDAHDFTVDPTYSSEGGQFVFFLADNAADFRLASLVDRGLVWHMLGSPRMLATTTAGLVRYIEPHVKAQLAQNYAATGVDDPATTPLRLTLLTGREPSLLDADSVLTSGDVESPNSNLTFNGEFAVLQPELFRRAGVDTAADDILANPPHIVVALLGPEVASVISEVESAWELNAPSLGVMRPFWVLYDSASHAAQLPSTLASLEQLTPPPSERLVGASFARSQDPQAQTLYGAYQSRLFGFYRDQRLAPVLAGTQADYEAAYAMIYAHIAASANGSVPDAMDLEDALKNRVFSPNAEDSVNLGPAYVRTAMRLLGDYMNIALYGTMGAPIFERSSGTRETGTSVWCLEPENTTRPYVYDALLYDPGTDSFVAPASGTGSCAVQYQPVQN
jgi:hypothetical protein